MRRHDGRVLAFERADTPGSWQLPQGGIRSGETPVDAVWRELEEETGLTEDDVVMVGQHPEWTLYEWPVERVDGGDRLGQAHRWFEFVAGADAVPAPDGSEFTAWKWVSVPWLLEHVVGFRKASYAKVLDTPSTVTPQPGEWR